MAARRAPILCLLLAASAAALLVNEPGSLLDGGQAAAAAAAAAVAAASAGFPASSSRAAVGPEEGGDGLEEGSPPSPGARAAAAAQQAVQAGPPPCSEEERRVIEPLRMVQGRIRGRIANGTARVPHPAPDECLGASSLYARMSCYRAWGFTRPVASCWAVEDSKRYAECKDQCVRNGQLAENSEECTFCAARLRTERQLCVYQASGISDGCQTCELKTYRFWDAQCMPLCKESIQKAHQASARALITPMCKSCNDAVEEALGHCGAQ